MRGLTRDTLLHVLDRKAVWLFGGVTLLAIVFAIIASRATFEVRIHSSSGALGDESVALASTLLQRVFGAYLSFLVFLAVAASSVHLPSLMERGRAEYYLARPVSRSLLFMGVYWGQLAVYGLIVAVSLLIVWLTSSLAVGVLNPDVLFLLLMHLCNLAIWLGITALGAMLFGSSAMAVVVAMLVWVAQSLLGQYRSLEAITENRILIGVVRTLYYLFPKTSEIGDIGLRLATDGVVTSWQPLWSSGLFAVGCLGVALYAFKRRSF